MDFRANALAEKEIESIETAVNREFKALRLAEQAQNLSGSDYSDTNIVEEFAQLLETQSTHIKLLTQDRVNAIGKQAADDRQREKEKVLKGVEDQAQSMRDMVSPMYIKQRRTNT